jgi:hypothetical protein
MCSGAANSERHKTSVAVSSVAMRTNNPAVLHSTADAATMRMPRRCA